MVLPCFLGTLIFLDKEIAKKHGIARHEAGLGRSEYQESGGKGGTWVACDLRAAFFFPPVKLGDDVAMENHHFFDTR